MKKLCLIFLCLTISCGGGGGGSSNFNIPTPNIPLKVEKIIDNLAFPTSLAFTPDGRIFFTELASGKVRIFGNDNLINTPFVQLESPAKGTTNGPVGIVIDPEYQINRYVYIYHYSSENGGENRVTRFKDQAGSATESKVLVNNLPTFGHVGGKLTFSKEGNLLISTGDNGNPSLAQDEKSLAGKILITNQNGEKLPKNPFNNLVFAKGFRNVFGMAVNPSNGLLYASDNGPDCDDEINKITSAGNYGWRESQPCSDTAAEYIQPIQRINPVLGVTGITFYTGNNIPEFKNHLLLADYNTGFIRRYVVDNESILEEAIILNGGYGPILDIQVSKEGYIYFCTTDAIYRLTRII